MKPAFIPYGQYWSTPFARWQGSLAHLHSLEFAAWNAKREIERRKLGDAPITSGVLGMTVPQQGSFYGLPWVMGLMGFASVGGPTISQACATSARCIALGGYNVYPREVEEVLFTHPHVVDAAVIGQADAYRGETLRAFIVMRAGQVFDADELRAFCKTNLAPYKVPARIDCLDALPKTSVSKTDKQELKKLAVDSSPGTQAAQTRA